MRYLLFLAFVGLSSLFAYGQKDLFVMRDGREVPVKVIYVSEDKAFFKDKDDVNLPDQCISLDDVFAIIREKGNSIIMISPTEKKTVGKLTTKSYRNSNLLVTKDNGIFNVEGLILTDTDVIALTSYTDDNGANAIAHTYYDVNELLFARKADGTKRMFTSKSDKEAQSVTPQPETVNDLPAVDDDTLNDFYDADFVEAEVELSVIFHVIEKGESLDKVAEKYDVTVSDIIEWNELPKQIKHDVPIKVGTQLILYVKNK